MRAQKMLLAAALLGAAVTLCSCNLTSGSKEREMDYRQQGIDLMNAGKYGSAVDMFQLALEQSVGIISDLDIDICYYKAAAQYNAGDVEGAIATYTSLIHYDEKNADAYYLRGTVYLEQSDLEAATADYEQAISLDSENYELYTHIYQNLEEAGQAKQGMTYLQQALELKGTDTAANREKGYIYYLTGDEEQALSLLESAVEDGDEKALLYLAQIKIDQEAYAEALELVNQGLAIEEGGYVQEFLYAEISLYEYMGDFSTAKEKMAAYLEAYPEDEQAVREQTFLSTR